MWQSTCASSVVTRPVKMYHATTIKSRIATKAPFAERIQIPQPVLAAKSELRRGSRRAAATGAAAAGGGVGVVGVELMIRFTFHFVYASFRVHGFDLAGGARQ